MKRLIFVFYLAGMSFILTDNAWGAVFRVNNLSDFQNALTIAGNNGEDDTIEVVSGTYNLTTSLTYFDREDHSILIRGTGTATTILDGGNSVQILNMDTLAAATDTNATITVREITFRNGNKTDSPGGGIRIETINAPILVEFCSFEGNHSTSNGGGVVLTTHFGTATLRNNLFHNNSSDQSGGGVYFGPVYSHTPLFLSYNLFSSNSANQAGGGISCGGLHGVTENNIFVGNTANEGGGWHGGASSQELILRNNIFIENSASTDGGAIHLWGENYLINNTIYGNTTTNRGGGVYIELFSLSYTTHIYNNIIWGNIASNGNDFRIEGTVPIVNLYNNDFGEFTIQDSSHLFQGNNINTDPQFVDIVSDDYHLSSISPCIDVGTSGAPFLPLTDFDGGTRVYNKIPDIGADEVALTLFGPKEGEQISSGSTFRIEWQSPPQAETFGLSYSLDGGNTWFPVQTVSPTREDTQGGLAATGPFMGTSLDWAVPLLTKNRGTCLIRIKAYNDKGTRIATNKSNGPFTIEVLTITNPQKKSTCTSGLHCTISWKKAPAVDAQVGQLFYSINGGLTWRLITNTITGSDTSYGWTPAVKATKTSCKVKLIYRDGTWKRVATAVSDGKFKIIVP